MNAQSQSEAYENYSNAVGKIMSEGKLTFGQSGRVEELGIVYGCVEDLNEILGIKVSKEDTNKNKSE